MGINHSDRTYTNKMWINDIDILMCNQDFMYVCMRVCIILLTTHVV